jgi:hypothetical protein
VFNSLFPTSSAPSMSWGETTPVSRSHIPLESFLICLCRTTPFLNLTITSRSRHSMGLPRIRLESICSIKCSGSCHSILLRFIDHPHIQAVIDSITSGINQSATQTHQKSTIEISQPSFPLQAMDLDFTVSLPTDESINVLFPDDFGDCSPDLLCYNTTNDLEPLINPFFTSSTDLRPIVDSPMTASSDSIPNTDEWEAIPLPPLPPTPPPSPSLWSPFE